MKKIVLSLTVAILIVIMACTEDFIETAPAAGKLTDENIVDKDGKLLKEVFVFQLTAAYAKLYGNNAGDPWLGAPDNWWFDVLTDDAHKGSYASDQPNLEPMQKYDWNTGNPFFLTKWQALYDGVVQANDLIRKGKELKGAEAEVSEARFLRGHFNFELQKIWGNVAYLSEDDTTADISNDGPIWEKIEADFQFAVENLPDAQAQKGRPNSWAAKAYLAKVLLQQNKYSAAIPIFTDVIDNGPYSLAADFNDNFTVSNENGPESVFAIQFTSQDGAEGTENGNLGGTLNHPNGGPYSSCCGFYQPSQDLANAYQTDANGLPLLDTYSQTDIANDNGVLSTNSFELHKGNLDPRIDYTIGRRGVDFNGFGKHPGSKWIRDGISSDVGLPKWSAGPYLGKKSAYKSEELSSSQGTGPWGQQSSGINYNVIRYGDVLLMAAEAEAEAGSIAKALEYVNMVRNRAKSMLYVNSPETKYLVEPYAAFVSKEEAIKAVRHERRLELAMEGHRLFDLRRYGSTDAIKTITDFVTNEKRTLPNFETGAFSEKHMVFPIPLGAIDQSNDKLKQNDEWK